MEEEQCGLKVEKVEREAWQVVKLLEWAEGQAVGMLPSGLRDPAVLGASSSSTFPRAAVYSMTKMSLLLFLLPFQEALGSMCRSS